MRAGREGRQRSLAALGALVAAVVLLAGCDWAQIGYGPDRRAYNPSEPALTEASVAHLTTTWSVPCTCTRALVAGGIAYAVDTPGSTPGTSSTLKAFDAATGAPKFSTPLGTGTGTIDAVANGLVYFTFTPTSGPDQLIARDATTGAFRFGLAPPTPGTDPARIADVVVDGARAFVAATSGGSTEVSAVDTTGHVVWAATPGGSGTNLVADPGHTVYIGTSIGLTTGPVSVHLLTGYHEEDGSLASRVTPQVTSWELAPAIIFANGLVYSYQPFTHGGTGMGMFAINPTTGDLAWGGVGSYPVSVTPTMLVSAGEHEWIAVDPLTGQFRWSVLAGGGAPSAGAAAGDLFFDGEGGSGSGSADTLNVRRSADGVIVGTFVPGPGETIVAVAPSSGRVYVSTVSRLYAVAPAA